MANLLRGRILLFISFYLSAPPLIYSNVCLMHADAKTVAASATRCWSKGSPNVSKSCLKSSNNSFYVRMRFSKLPIVLATFVGNFVPKNFKKLPNLVTLGQKFRIFFNFPHPLLSTAAAVSNAPNVNHL